MREELESAIGREDLRQIVIHAMASKVAREVSLKRAAAKCGVVRVARAVPGRQFSGARNVSASGFFKFGGASAEDNELASCREDYSINDASDYYDYMGLLAEHGTYDRFDQMVDSGLDPVDLILCMAVEEGDKPKIEALMDTGADASVIHPVFGKPVNEVSEDEDVIALLK